MNKMSSVAVIAATSQSTKVCGSSRSWERQGALSPGAFREKMALPRPRFQMSSLQNERRSISVICDHLCSCPRTHIPKDTDPMPRVSKEHHCEDERVHKWP